MGLASWLTVPDTHTRSFSVVVNLWFFLRVRLFYCVADHRVACVGRRADTPLCQSRSPTVSTRVGFFYLWTSKLLYVTAVSWHTYCVRAPGQEAASRVCPRQPACCSRHGVYLETADIWPTVRDQNGRTFLRNWPKKPMRHAFSSCPLVAPVLLFVWECN